MSELGVDLPTASPRVSDHVTHVINFIKKLQDRGYAYEVRGVTCIHVSDHVTRIAELNKKLLHVCLV